jgi:hypothetical protein
MLLAGVAGFVEKLVGFAGGQPFVAEVDGQAGQSAQFGGKGLNLGGLGADVAGKMHWIADHDAHDAKATAETGQRTQVVAAIVLPLQRQNWLSGQT